MRWFLIPAISTVAVALANPASAKAQVIVGGNPTFLAPYSLPVAPFPSTLLPGSAAIPFASGGPVELALNQALWSMASRGFGPYAGHYPFFAQPNVAGAYPTYYVPWNGVRPLNVPGNQGQWVQPLTGNPGLHKGWYKGGGKGKGGKGKG